MFFYAALTRQSQLKPFHRRFCLNVDIVRRKSLGIKLYQILNSIKCLDILSDDDDDGDLKKRFSHIL